MTALKEQYRKLGISEAVFDHCMKVRTDLKEIFEESEETAE